MKRIWWNNSDWKGVGGSVCRLACHLAIASKESHENHVRIVGCHSAATKKKGGGGGGDTVALEKKKLFFELIKPLLNF